MMCVTMNADLLDLSERWIGHQKGNSLLFTYDRCVTLAEIGQFQDHDQDTLHGDADDRCVERHKPGTPMIRLVRKPHQRHGQLVLTDILEFEGSGHPKGSTGVSYFQKAQPN